LLAVFLAAFSSTSGLGQPKKQGNDECLRKTVWAEARGEGKLGQRAVAHVILNRVKQHKKSICTIVHQKGQFKQGTPSKNFKVPFLGIDPTNGATYFRTKDAPRWHGYKKKIRIGNHTFYG
jgi:spore germination cell wall hydrolase CwlJ-like protein